MENQVDNSTTETSAPETSATESTSILETTSTPETAADWRASLSEEHRGSKALENFKSADDLAKSYIHAQSMIGGSIRIPSEEAGQEQRDEFFNKLESVDGVIRFDPDNLDGVYKKLGRPETASDYQLEVPDEVKDVAISDEARGQFQKLAHELGLNNAQASKLLSFDLTRTAALAQKNSDLHDKSMQTLKTEFGDEYQNALETANATLDNISAQYPDLKELIDTVPEAANNAGLIAMLAKYGKAMAEKGSAEFKGVGRIGITPEEAQQRINEKKLDTDFMDAWLMVNHAGHAAAVETMNDLYKKANPG